MQALSYLTRQTLTVRGPERCFSRAFAPLCVLRGSKKVLKFSVPLRVLRGQKVLKFSAPSPSRQFTEN